MSSGRQNEQIAGPAGTATGARLVLRRRCQLSRSDPEGIRAPRRGRDSKQPRPADPSHVSCWSCVVARQSASRGLPVTPRRIVTCRQCERRRVTVSAIMRFTDSGSQSATHRIAPAGRSGETISPLTPPPGTGCGTVRFCESKFVGIHRAFRRPVDMGPR